MRQDLQGSRLTRLLACYRSLPFGLRGFTVLLWVAVIWWSSSRMGGGGDAGQWQVVLSNGAHFFVFGLLAVLSLASFGSSTRVAVCVSFLIALSYGVVDELHQAQVPGRDASWEDVVTDLCGAAAALAGVLWIEGSRGALGKALCFAVLGLAAVFLASS